MVGMPLWDATLASYGRLRNAQQGQPNPTDTSNSFLNRLCSKEYPETPPHCHRKLVQNRWFTFVIKTLSRLVDKSTESATLKQG